MRSRRQSRPLGCGRTSWHRSRRKNGPFAPGSAGRRGSLPGCGRGSGGRAFRVSRYAFLAFGFLAGVRRASFVAQPAADSTARQLAELNSRVDSMGRLVSYTLLQQQKSSANDRLEGELMSATLQRPTENVIDNLVSTLVLDPSVNCRLNAVEALYAHADSDVVRTAIRVSLPREQSPLVQLAMIDFLAAVRDRDAAPAFDKLSASALADPSVRAAAVVIESGPALFGRAGMV